MQQKKILILTLGNGMLAETIRREESGKLLPDEIRALKKERRDQHRSDLLKIVTEAKEKPVFKYRPTKYRMDGGDQPVIETSFVAEILAKEYAPDEIVILGTAGSAWTAFYINFADGIEEEDVLALDDTEYGCGMDTDADALAESAKRISAIYDRKLKKKLFPQEDVTSCRIRVVLLRFGINDRELKTNYDILSAVWDEMDRDTEYRVAFDITHSFRSLPIYNLVLLDYYHLVRDMHITIEHVWYGMFEAANDMPDKAAPIVDLRDLVNVMRLSRSISEFRDTGISLRLNEEIRSETGSDDLDSAMDDFYWSVQLNDIAGIRKALKDIAEVLSDELTGSGRYNDIGKMLKDAITDEMLEGTPVDEFAKAADPVQFARLQLMLAKWHLKKNRYGNAAVTSLEAMTSFLVKIFLEHQLGRVPTFQECAVFQKREDAVKTQLYVHKKTEHQNETADEDANTFLNRLAWKTEGIRGIRNMICHTTESGDDLKEAGPEETDPSKVIREYVDIVAELERRLMDDVKRQQFCAAYLLQGSQVQKKGDTGVEQGVTPDEPKSEKASSEAVQASSDAPAETRSSVPAAETVPGTTIDSNTYIFITDQFADDDAVRYVSFDGKRQHPVKRVPQSVMEICKKKSLSEAGNFLAEYLYRKQQVPVDIKVYLYFPEEPEKADIYAWMITSEVMRRKQEQGARGRELFSKMESTRVLMKQTGNRYRYRKISPSQFGLFIRPTQRVQQNNTLDMNNCDAPLEDV